MGSFRCCALVVVLFFTVPICFTTPYGNTVVFFDCTFTYTDERQHVNVTEFMKDRNITLNVVCEKDILKIVPVLTNTTIDLFVGPFDSSFDMEIRTLARANDRPYISPFATLPYEKKDVCFSLGPSFTQMGQALSTVLTHFQWKRIRLITESSQFYNRMATSIYMTLSGAGFLPEVIYIAQEADDSDVQKVLSKAKSNQKAIVLVVNNNLQLKILKQAALSKMQLQHAFFIMEYSSYSSIEKYDFSDLDHNITDVLDNLFIILPVFQTTHTIQKRASGNGPPGFVPTGQEEISFHMEESLNFTSKRRKKRNSESDNEKTYLGDALNVIQSLLELSSDRDHVNNSQWFDRLINHTLTISSGDIKVGASSELVFDFVLYDFRSDNMQPVIAQKILQLGDGGWELQGISNIIWPNGVPLGPDSCFHPDSCQTSPGLDALYVLSIALAVIFVICVATAIVIIVWRKVIHKEMIKGHQKVLLTSDDLVFLTRKDVMKGSKLINGTITEKPDLLKASEKPNRSLASLHEYADVTETARFNGDLVHVKEFKAKGFEMKHKLLTFIKTLREIRHENVNAVVGFFDDPQQPAIISDYCMRGSLEDVLQNHDIKLDWDFKVSLLTDLIRGIRYLHNSALRCHGNLKSRNCVIDSRWVLKVTDFGIAGLHEGAKVTPVFTDKDLLFTAPEHLRSPCPPLTGSEKGDVYSLSIIMQCVVLRTGPYSTSGLSVKEIIQKLKHPPPLLRPSVSHGTAPPQYIQIMKVCWSENPDMRPTVEEIYQQFKLITGGKKLNIVDTMFRMLEKYSTDLEDLVKERTLQLEEEKKKTDLLLYRMLPLTVADSLKTGLPVPAEHFSEVSIYFSDIVGFTTISAHSTPMQVVNLLNGLYTMFDATIDSYDVYKVETIGDAYMVSSGLPLRNGNRHAGEVATMALDLLSQCGNFTIKHMPEVPLRVRIGLHSGSCVAGVVGSTMPRYCLFGDTVNVASRMESTGAAYRIHISEQVKRILDVLGDYETEYRGEVELKGKGMAKTYWLTSKKGFAKKLPEPPPLGEGDNHGISEETMRKISTGIPSPTKPNNEHQDMDIVINNSGKLIEEILRETNSPVGSISSLKSNSNLNELLLRTSPLRTQVRKASLDGGPNLRLSPTSIHSHCSGCSHAASSSSEMETNVHQLLTHNDIIIHRPSDTATTGDNSSVVLPTRSDSQAQEGCFSVPSTPRVIRVEEACLHSDPYTDVSRRSSHEIGVMESILKSPERKGKIRVPEAGSTRVSFQESLV